MWAESSTGANQRRLRDAPQGSRRTANTPKFPTSTNPQFHHKKRSKGKGWEPRTDKIGRIDPAVIDNPLFTEYYQAQAVMPAEEWDAFIACMRQPLPITFRINGTGRFAAELRTKLEKDYLSHLQSTPMEVRPPQTTTAALNNQCAPSDIHVCSPVLNNI